jgi:hypothetical protein
MVQHVLSAVISFLSFFQCALKETNINGKSVPLSLSLSKKEESSENVYVFYAPNIPFTDLNLLNIASANMSPISMKKFCEFRSFQNGYFVITMGKGHFNKFPHRKYLKIN